MSKTLSLLRRDAVAGVGNTIYSLKGNRKIEFNEDRKYALVIEEVEDMTAYFYAGINKQGYLLSSYHHARNLAITAFKLQTIEKVFCEVIDCDGEIYDIDLDSTSGIGLSKTGVRVAIDEFADLHEYKEIKACYNDILGVLTAFKKSKQSTPDDYKYMVNLEAKAHKAMTMFNYTNELAVAEKEGIFGDDFFTPSEVYEQQTIIRLMAIKNQLDYGLVLTKIVIDSGDDSVHKTNHKLALARREAIRAKGQSYLEEAAKHPNLIDHEARGQVGKIINIKLDKAWSEYIEESDKFYVDINDIPYESIIREYNTLEDNIARAQEALNQAVSDDAVQKLLVSQRYIEARSRL